MKIGLAGLGKMGFNMRLRLQRAGIEVVAYDPQVESDADSLEELVNLLDPGSIVWLMVPSGDVTRQAINELAGLLDEGSLVVDGGNSHFTDDQPNADILARYGIGFVDCGVSGGVWGLENGYGLMAGGSKEHIERLMPLFDALRPEGPREEGFVHVGPVGAGHFAKMTHNGIEYGLMHPWGEGYELLKASSLVNNPRAVLKAWQRGTVVRSWLLDLLVRALEEDPDLASITGYVEDSGEARWTVEAALDLRVPVPAISTALFARFSSRQEESPAMQVVAALRNQFGGHATKPS